MSERLKACPFCGAHDPTVGEPAGDDPGYEWLGVHVHCEGCPANIYGFPTLDEAIAAWNRRAEVSDD